MIRDILEASCDACYPNGFPKILIVTSHGGNQPLVNAFEGDSHPGINERIARAYAEKTVATTAEVIRFLKEETVSLAYFAQYQQKLRRHEAQLESR